MVRVYLRSDTTGQHLGLASPEKSAEALATHEHVGDESIWELQLRLPPADGGDHAGHARRYNLVCAVGGLELRAKEVAPLRPPYGEKGVSLEIKGPQGELLTDDGTASAGSPAVFTALTAPPRLPSEYIAEMNAVGYAMIEGILQPDDLAEMRTAVGQMLVEADQPDEGRFSLDSNALLSNCPTLAKASFHPVALRCIQGYLGVPDLQQSHIPVFTVLKPAGEKLRGPAKPGGWHSDYPYRQGRFVDEKWPAFPRLGVQYNICVDEFTEANGGTQYIPGVVTLFILVTTPILVYVILSFRDRDRVSSQGSAAAGKTRRRDY